MKFTVVIVTFYIAAAILLSGCGNMGASGGGNSFGSSGATSFGDDSGSSGSSSSSGGDSGGGPTGIPLRHNPEPATIALFSLGLAGLAFAKRKNRK